MEQAGVQLIAQGASAYFGDLKSATNATNTFVDATDKGSGKVSKAGEIMTGALRHIGTIAVDALAQAAKATAAFVGDSIGLAGDFEAGMLNFQAVAGKDVDTEGLEDFRDLFLQIGKELPVSTAEVQQAATEMIKGGIDPAIVAAGGLRQNIQFAAAAMEGDLVSAAEISAKILGGWADASATAQQKADFLTHSTDLLTKAANASAVDVKGLSQGIFNAQGIAKTAGVSFDDLTTTLAALAPRFASTSEAGNSLKNMIARLQPTTSPAASAMEGLGLYSEETGSAFYDLQGNFVGFEKAAQLLQDSLKGMTKEQQALALQTIFGNDAMGSAAALADMGAAGYTNMADAMAKANGVAENAALKQQGFNTALDNAKGSVEALQITIGSALLPVITDLINNVVAPGINKLTDLADAVFGNDDAFNRLSPTMQDVAKTIQQLADDFMAGVQAAQEIAAQVDALLDVFGQAEAESGALGGAVDDLSGVWEHASDVIADVMDAYVMIAQAVLPIITQFVAEHGEEISAFFKAAWDSIIEIVNLALDIYDAIVPAVLEEIAGFISAHGSEITKVLSGAWEMISSLITGTLETIKGVFKVTLAVIHGDWEGAWEGVKGIAEAQATAIGGIVTGFLDLIAGIFDTTFNDILQTWEDNWNMLMDIATSLDWSNVGYYAVMGILGGLRDNWSSIVGWITEKMSGLVDAAMEAIGANSPAVAFMPVGQFSVLGIMAGFEATWPQLTAMVSSLGDDLASQAADIAASVQDAIGDAFGATASIDRQKVANLRDVGKLDEKRRAGVQSQINEAEKIAAAMDDPVEAANYFKMRSKQLIELGELGDKINTETDRTKRAQLQAEYDLINAAQQAEMKQFEAQQAATKNTTESLVDSVNALMAAISKVHLNDDQIKIVGLLSGLWGSLQNIPHRAGGGPVDAFQPYWVGEKGPELFWPTMAGRISPAASSQQMAGRATSNSYSQNKTINMPIYTNQSPAVLQQSWAIMQASMT